MKALGVLLLCLCALGVEGSWIRVQVRRGDTLWAISRRYGTTVSQIASANRIRNVNYIRVGQILWVPRASRPAATVRRVAPRRPVQRRRVQRRPVQRFVASHPTSGRFVTVQRGDSLSLIAWRYGVSLRDLLWANPQIHNPNLIFAGQRVNLPSRSSSAPRQQPRQQQRQQQPSQRRPLPPPRQSSGSGPSISGLPSSFVSLIRSREGFRSYVYRDSRGFPTAGTGHLMRPAELARYPVGSTVPSSVLNAWFASDAGPAYRAGLQQAGELGLAGDQEIVNVFGSMSFQLGLGWPQEFPTLWSLLRNHRFNSAAADAEQTAWDNQTPTRVQDLVHALRDLIAQHQQ